MRVWLPSDTRRVITRVECGFDPRVRISAIEMEMQELEEEKRNLRGLMRIERWWRFKQRFFDWIKKTVPASNRYRMPPATPIRPMGVELETGKTYEVQIKRGTLYVRSAV